MRLYDAHTHSLCSPDSDSPQAEMVAAARQAGLKGLCITDHYDVLDFDGNYCPSYDWILPRQEHRRGIAAAGEDIYLGYGLELGNAPADFEAARRVLEEPLDFVIGSIHNMSRCWRDPDTDPAWGLRPGLDYYEMRFTSDSMCQTVMRDYCDQLLALALWGGFDVMGHIPYPLRYMHRDGQAPDFSRQREVLDCVLVTLAETGKGLEVNTNRGRDMEQYRPLMERFRSVGGEIVTVGSDAHRPEDVGKGIRESYDLLRDCGFRYAAVFRNREPEMTRL